MRKSIMTSVTALVFALTLVSGILLSSPFANADSSSHVDLTVVVSTACSLGLDDDMLAKTIIPGTSDTIGTTGIQAFCNDMEGFAIYAAGYTDDEYTNNYLVTDLGDEYKIATGADASPSNSQWYMKVEESDVANNYDVSIADGFDEDHEVPEYYEKIAFRNSITDATIGANFNVTFGAYIAPNQIAGVYNGKVKFLLVHPNIYGYNSVTSEPETFAPETLEMPFSVRLSEDYTVYDNRNGSYSNPKVIPAGSIVTIKSKSGDFIEVEAEDGTSGYNLLWDIEGVSDMLDEELGDRMAVYIFISRRPVMTEGETVYLTSRLLGFEGYELAYIWECDKGNGYEEVTTIENGEDHYEFPASAESLSWGWRLTVLYR